jgi:uncharacterized membrane protein
MATQLQTHEIAPFDRAKPEQAQRDVLGIAADRVARGLGWFSIGLGLAELIVPDAIARLVGSRNHSWLIRSYGLREIAAGVGLLTAARQTPWLWSRVAGDVVDLASLGAVAESRRKHRGKTIAAMASVAGVTVLDVCCAARFSKAGSESAAKHAEANMIVDRPPEECYRFWHDFENLPRFMSYLQSVRVTGDRVSRWAARTPGGARIEWNAEMTEDQPNRRIAWRSLDGSMFQNSGAVDFEPAPGGRGTIIRVQMDYGNLLGSLESVATLMGQDPEQMVRKELRRFKQVMETGEVITTEGQPRGGGRGETWLDRVAR